MSNRRRAILLCLFFYLALLSGCTQDRSRAFNKAADVFASGDYESAAEAFERLGDYATAATYAAYSRGMVFYEQELYAEAEPYFAQARGFMYGDERYLICHASALETQGQYAEAAQTLESIRGFEEVELHYQYCLGRDAEQNAQYGKALSAYEAAGLYADAEDRLYSLRGQIYNRAIELRMNEDYQAAIDLFNLLGDYLSSAEQAVACKEYLREDQYNQAETLLNAGDTQGAYNLFSSLTGYRDAAARAEQLANRLGIDASGNP